MDIDTGNGGSYMSKKVGDIIMKDGIYQILDSIENSKCRYLPYGEYLAKSSMLDAKHESVEKILRLICGMLNIDYVRMKHFINQYSTPYNEDVRND